MTEAGLTERLAQLPPDLRGEFADRLQRAAATVAAEPIAIIGIGCRFPRHVSGSESYWAHLRDGWDAIRDAPPGRWDTALNGAPQRAGFLDDIAGFDAAFFRISAEEAAAMDPQQRILLEVACDALFDAGYAPQSLASERIGIFAGVYYNDYLRLSAASGPSAGAYTTTGNAHSITASRLAYLFDLRGPAMAVDTACSSSLVAVHLACQALRLRECDAALAGGVSLLLAPDTQSALAQWGMLSPTGACRAFDAGADGIVRGEGAGAVVLKRLTDAIADNDRVVAVLRGSAVMQDGRSQGLTAPSTLAQRDVLAEALARAGVTASQVGYIETHGTGTTLGDPIEVDALSMVYGDGPGRCALGSVKTNMGHLEAAAGIAGLIKASLAVHHGEIPPSLHFRRWNPAIEPVPARFFVPAEVTPWPAQIGLRLAAVSSFGFGGTNAHAIVEQAPTGVLSRNAGSGSRRRWRHEPYWPASSGRPDASQEPTGKGIGLLGLAARVLGRPGITPEENFFDAGGDSLLAMRLISMAKRQGIVVSPDDLRKSALGSIAEEPTVPGPDGQLPATGLGRNIPLTPIQHFFLARPNLTPDHWDIQLLVENDEPPSLQNLARAADIVVGRHDALRLRIERDASGWRQAIAPPGLDRAAVIRELDLITADEGSALDLLRSMAAEFQRTRSLARGPVLSIAHGVRGPGRPSMDLVTLHHLAADTHSLWILLTELFTACRQLQAGHQVDLPQVTSSFAEWATSMADLAGTPAITEQRPFWLSQRDQATVELPADHDLGPAVLGSIASHSASLDERETRRLLSAGPDTVPILLTALVTALSSWVPSGELLVDVRDQGRTALSQLDLSWTMGWFTSLFPLALPLGSADPLGEVRTRLGQVPDHGIGYGLLRYLAHDRAGVPPHQAEVGFNYLGHLDVGTLHGPIRYASRQVRAYPDPQAAIDWPLDLKAGITKGRLHLTMIYSQNRYRRQTIEELTARFMTALRVRLPGEDPGR